MADEVDNVISIKDVLYDRANTDFKRKQRQYHTTEAEIFQLEYEIYKLTQKLYKMKEELTQLDSRRKEHI